MSTPRIKTREAPAAATPTNGSRLLALAREAAEVLREYSEHNSLAAIKASAPAFLREALRLAWPGLPEDAAREKCEALREKLRHPQTHHQDELRAVVRRFERMWCSMNWSWPVSEMRRIRHVLTPEAMVEMQGAGISIFELSAVAALDATEKEPEAFGRSESPEAYDRKLLELTARRDALFAAIAAAPITLAEMEMSEPDGAGRYAVWVAGTNRAVLLAPQENLAERLCNYLLTQREQHS